MSSHKAEETECCQPKHEPSCCEPQLEPDCCGTQHDKGKRKIDYLLWGSGSIILIFYLTHLLAADKVAAFDVLHIFSHSVFELINTMWFGILLGVFMIGILSKIPREFVISLLGEKRGLSSILRASFGGILLDLCNHGILMVAVKLYERGASTGQVIAFLVSSPWNSFSLTLVLWALIGLPWTLAFIVLSMVIAVITGLIFEKLTDKGIIPPNPHKIDLPEDFNFREEARKKLKVTTYNKAFFMDMAIHAVKDSRMVMRWLLFGIVLASLIRTFVSPEIFGTYFGPTLLGLGLTLIAATVIEVCSEGSTPIAADLLTRAKAPGNAFAFLMAGASTDYTEIMVLRERTKSWRIPLFLPLVTLPQILLLAYMINLFGT